MKTFQVAGSVSADAAGRTTCGNIYSVEVTRRLAGRCGSDGKGDYVEVAVDSATGIKAGDVVNVYLLARKDSWDAEVEEGHPAWQLWRVEAVSLRGRTARLYGYALTIAP